MRIHAFGGPEQIRCDEVPVPRPGPGQLLLKMAACGVNYKDTHVRAGGYDVPLPFTLGREGAGVVEAIGPGVTGVALGDRVAFAPEIGAYAEYNLLSAERAVPLPEGIDFSSAAAVMLQGMSAHFLVHDSWPVQAGDRVLIHAGAGGVGLLLIQMCKAKGATVLTTVSTEEKEAVARGAGADHVIRYTQVDFELAARNIVGAAGIDVIYDAVGLTTFEAGLRLLRRRGMMVLYGRSSGLPDLNALAWQGSHYLCQPILGDHIVTREALLARASAVLQMVAEDRLKLRIGGVYPLAEAARAHADLNGRATTGKLLLQP